MWVGLGGEEGGLWMFEPLDLDRACLPGMINTYHHRDHHDNDDHHDISPDLREKFIKTESELFRHRFESDDANEKQEFLKSLQFDWVTVSRGLSTYSRCRQVSLADSLCAAPVA